MSSLCLICEGYSSDGSDYYVRRRRRDSSECSGCDDSICECHDSCDCSDWESGSERESEHKGSLAKQKGNNDKDEPSGSESEVEDRGRKIPSKHSTETEDKDEEPEFVKAKDYQEERDKEKAKNRPQGAGPKSDESDSASDNKSVTSQSCSQSDNSEESDKEKQNENNKHDNSESSDENGYPKEIQEFLQQNEGAESSDNKGVRTRRYANYYGRNNRGYRRRPRRRQNERSGAGHKNRHSNRRRQRRSTRRRNLYSKVKMPNGEFHWITVPAAEKKSWKCGTETELITLRPNGRMGKKEHQLITEQMEGTRKNHISGAYSGYEIMKIQKIVNPCLWKRYRHRRYDVKTEVHGGAVTEQMLFHGSPAIKELIQNGFDERYSSTSGMFGAGIYFAENSSKSNQYAWGLNKGCPTHNNKNCMICERQLLLCRVTLGKVKEFTAAQRLAHAPVGYHSVKGVPNGTANGLQYSENIVYRGEQVYPEFLITYKQKP